MHHVSVTLKCQFSKVIYKYNALFTRHPYKIPFWIRNDFSERERRDLSQNVG